MPSIADAKKSLEDRRRMLLAEASDIEQTLREPDSRDDEDRATETEGDEVLEGLGNAHLEEIEAIDAALKRIELGTYGECTHCGAEISDERLEAVPHTPFCINCAA